MVLQQQLAVVGSHLASSSSSLAAWQVGQESRLSPGLSLVAVLGSCVPTIVGRAGTVLGLWRTMMHAGLCGHAPAV